MPTNGGRELELWITSELQVSELLRRIEETKVREAGSHIRDLSMMIPQIISETLVDDRSPDWWRATFQRIGRCVLNILGRYDYTEFCKLLVSKHKAYGAAPIKLGGMQGILNRMASKCARAENIQLGVADASQDETYIDTMLDIIGYAILGLLLADRLEAKTGTLTVEVTTLVAQKAVGDFHTKHGFDKDLDLTKFPKTSMTANHLRLLGTMLKDRAKYMEKGSVADEGYDTRIMRAHLICEELGELLEAMADGDEVETLDGLADLVYVVAGTAVAFDLPLNEGFIEVHRSNMTKAVKAGGADDMRCRTKGASYVPPDIASVLSRHRGNKKAEEADFDFSNKDAEHDAG